MTMVFGREKSFRLGESSFPIHEDFSLGLKNRTKYYYDAYGKVTFCDGSWTPLTSGGNNSSSTPGVSSAYGNEILYCGYILDAETSNNLARNRYYSVTYATWISRDPIEADSNLYRYCRNDPLTCTDPTGEASVLEPITVEPPEGGTNCTMKPWYSDWMLSERSEIGGVIIQHMTGLIDVELCDHEVIERRVIDYWEAWLVEPGEFKPVSMVGPPQLEYPDAPCPPEEEPAHDDKWGVNDYGKPCTRGFVIMVGTAEFHEGLDIPPDFVQHKDPHRPAIDLPSTDRNPGFLPGGTGLVSRSMQIWWNCCDEGDCLLHVSAFGDETADEAAMPEW
jgi:RHS repeat-associated protein